MRIGLSYKLTQIDTVTENRMCISKFDNGFEMTFYFSSLSCQIEFDMMPKTNILTINFSDDYIMSFDKNASLVIPTIKEKNICCTTQLILHEIMNAKYTGVLKSMFIESKAINLLLCAIKCEIPSFSGCETCKFLNNPYEKEKITKARDILLNNIQNPPSIPELAKQVGLNQCYLKKGFKDVFDTTIFGFVQEQRILKAKLLLTSSQQSITDIAEQIGFSNPSNFTNAFKNFTGILPSEMRIK